jgi:hypothetical protein
MSLEVIAIGSDNLVRLDQLQSASSGQYVNAATVTFVLKDSTGAVIQNTTTMPYVSASNGRYEGTITAATSATLAQNGQYSIEITATYLGATLFRRLSSIAKYRSNQ